MPNKIISVILCFVLLLSITGCESNDLNKKVRDEEKTHTHEYDEASCTLPKTCECGETKGEALGHDFLDATCTASQICSRCGLTNGEPLGHSFADATCTTARTCSRCKTTDGDKLGHDYSDATCTTAQICRKCSAVSGNALGHDYVDYFCSRCDMQDPESLPVPLHTLPVIDSTYECYYYDRILTDNFDKTYVGYHFFQETGNDPGTAIYYLDGKYSRFTCDVLTLCGEEVSFVVYVDDRIVYQSEKFDKVDGIIHVDVNIKNGQQLKISSWNHSYSWADTIYVVNTELSKF